MGPVSFQWKVRHDTFVVCCKFSPNGKFVLSALDVDRGIYLMDPENITTVIHMKGEVAKLPTPGSNT